MPVDIVHFLKVRYCDAVDVNMNIYIQYKDIFNCSVVESYFYLKSKKY
jgi:hypothetical protein